MAAHVTRRTVIAAGATLAAGAAMTAKAVIAAPNASAATTPPPARPRLSLPAPTGRCPVGAADLHLVDSSRSDPLVPGTRNRELMVRLWYPATAERRPVARYLTPSVGALLVDELNILAGTSYPVDLLTFPTHGRRHGPALPGRRRPVVLFSPGRSTNAAFYTALCEDLASRGYVVAGIDHTFDAVVEFPGGRIEIPPADLPDDALLPVRVADTRFVLDQLVALASGRNPDAGRRTLPHGLARIVDASTVAAVGHSLGSRTAVETINQDRRISAGAALDGNPLGPASLHQPFLLLGNQGHRRADDPDWAAFYDRLRGPRRHLVIDGAEHHDLSDITVFKALIDLGAIFNVGPIDGTRALTIERSYLAAWLDYALRTQDNLLLHGESRAFPEVDFQP